MNDPKLSLPILLLCLLLPCHRSAQLSPCPRLLSIAIPDDESQLHPGNGSLVHNNIEYTAGNHWREGNVTRGCICRASASKACLRKCCPWGSTIVPSEEFSRDNQCVRDAESNRSDITFHHHDELTRFAHDEAQQRFDLRDWFVPFESQGCPESSFMMILDPDKYVEDAYVLYTNGSLYLNGSLPYKISPETLAVDSFCIDRQKGNDKQMVVRCMLNSTNSGADDDPVLAHVRVGYMMSLPFFAVTFLVYAIIPELRNIYGKTLMCYVIALLTAYSSISISHFHSYGTACVVTDGILGLKLSKEMKSFSAILVLLALVLSSELGSANPIDKREAAAKKYSETCGKNELFNTCGSTCERNCDDVNNDDRNGERCVRAAVCVEKCTCMNGYVREKEGGKCIRIQECPRVKH